jgi:ATP-dependent Lhr-like helicase
MLAAGLFNKLSGNMWPVYFHVGILSRSERERVETAMKAERFGVCIATSTLELGIDIGDIDVIVLAEPPSSINTFLQRIGRGNRRSNLCKVVTISTDEQERSIYQALLHCARLGLLDEVHEYDRPSVRFQQVLSLAWRGVRGSRPLTYNNLIHQTGGEDHSRVVEDMVSTGALQDIAGVLIPADDLMDEGDRRMIHSVISGSSNVPLVDGSTGEILGYAGHEGIDPGSIFLGGKLTRVDSGYNGEVYLEPISGQIGLSLTRLPSTRGRRGLSRRVVWGIAELAGINPRRWTRSGSRLQTWGGAKFNRLLSIILEQTYKLQGLKIDDFGLDNVDPLTGIEPKDIYTLAQNPQLKNDISPGSATYFCEPSRYLHRLSPKLRAIEAINSIPIQPFLTWLSECNKFK